MIRIPKITWYRGDKQRDILINMNNKDKNKNNFISEIYDVSRSNINFLS